jgi:hypothetical protein
MGTGANNSGNKSLNDRRERAEGRQHDRGPAAEAIKESVLPKAGKGETGGAFGKDGHANTKQGNSLGEGGGGGGGSPNRDIVDVGASTKPAKKQS